MVNRFELNWLNVSIFERTHHWLTWPFSIVLAQFDSSQIYLWAHTGLYCVLFTVAIWFISTQIYPKTFYLTISLRKFIYNSYNNFSMNSDLFWWLNFLWKHATKSSRTIGATRSSCDENPGVWNIYLSCNFDAEDTLFGTVQNKFYWTKKNG